jgi:thiamine pyrophosphate-dependent acetolactate synthase large subunit-like protein
MKRDAILVIDRQETLNFRRRSMPTFESGHRLNSEPFGTMGVGLRLPSAPRRHALTSR